MSLIEKDIVMKNLDQLVTYIIGREEWFTKQKMNTSALLSGINFARMAIEAAENENEGSCFCPYCGAKMKLPNEEETNNNATC